MLLVDDEWQLRRWRPLYLQSPQELRGTAARHRQMAEIVSSGDIAVRLRRLAKRYERLANERERKADCRQPRRLSAGRNARSAQSNEPRKRNDQSWR